VTIELLFLGSGDAFGSGGRLQASFLLRGAESRLLVDCGATALIAMRRFGIDPDDVDAILVSHLHGDHFAGIPFLLLDGQFVSKRTRPLVIAGPAGTPQRLETTMEALFPGSSNAQRRFPLELVELEPGRRSAVAGAAVTPYAVTHSSGAPALALRVELEGKVVAYSGDTEWTEALVDAAHDADLFIAEAYYYDKRVPGHLDFVTLNEQRERLGARRTILTHMSADMLNRVESLGCETAEDGKLVQL
jgi:ribonuclease BN (tRNA processing enzyme)